MCVCTACSCLVCSCGDFAHVRPAADDSADLKIVSKIVIFDFQNPVTFLLKRAPRESLSAGLLAGPDRGPSLIYQNLKRLKPVSHTKLLADP